MILAVKDALQRQQFLRAAQGRDYFRAVLGMRLALYGGRPAAGWQFFTGARGVCAALAVRGETAFSCGEWDDEELMAFLRFLGVRFWLTPDGAPGENCPCRLLHGYYLPPDVQLMLPAAKADFIVECTPQMRRVTRLLWGESPDADDFYAEACMARNSGMAEYRLALMQGEPVATVGACAVYAGEAYMAAGETAERFRGKGIGGRLIVSLANELAARGQRVTLLCEDSLCAFYERLGFRAGAVYRKWELQAEKAGTE